MFESEVVAAADPAVAAEETSNNSGTVVVNVTMDGSPEDAQVVARNSSGGVVDLVYTNLTDTGTATFELPLGEYELEIDAGGNHISKGVNRTITVESGETTSLDVEVTQLYEPNDRGWYAVDPHGHSKFSVDSETPIETFVSAQIAAQLDAITVSDHYSVAGHTPTKNLAQEAEMPYILSQDITSLSSNGSTTCGHHNTNPLHENEYVNESGSPSEFYEDARDAGADTIHVNHPYYGGGIEYFNQMVGTFDFNGSFNAAGVYKRA